MSEEAINLVSKIRQIDKRLVQLQANDERILHEGGARAATYQPMAPRAEMERDKLLTRLRQLEAREGKLYYQDPSEMPFEDEGPPVPEEALRPDPFPAAGEAGKVRLQSREEQIAEWASPPTPDGPSLPKKGGNSTQSTPQVRSPGNASAAAPRNALSTGTMRTNILPEPAWDGMGVLFAVLAGMVLLMIGFGYVRISGSFNELLIPW